MVSTTTKRKASHIEVCLKRNVVPEGAATGLEDVRFVHEALPQVDFGKIDISAKLFGKRLKAPFIIEAMTGGHADSEKINRSLAEAAQETGIAMGLGSQRAMLENPALASTYQVRKV
ncbi:MAG: alpha-hydroxy-acid oxidizing protein, partial [Candidatus Micrarchaeota archaeon]|nr:alpha-hydroxy-acid oxidizing protein [Candidatus Micrarchaeota archaeon]